MNHLEELKIKMDVQAVQQRKAALAQPIHMPTPAALRKSLSKPYTATEKALIRAMDAGRPTSVFEW